MSNLSTAENDPRYSPRALVRRLLLERGLEHWPQYAVAFALMVVTAASTAAMAYLMKHVINETYVYKNLDGVLFVAGLTVVIFAVKGISTYGHTVILSKIGNRIVKECQRTVFAKLLREGLGFFSERHSTEFIARVTAGATSTTQAINLIIVSFGRDFLSLVGLVAVMIWQEPTLSLFSFVVAPPAFLVLRKLVRRVYKIGRSQFQGGAQIIETMQETLQGIRIVKAFTLEGVMQKRFDDSINLVEHEANKLARIGARSSPLMETLGGLAIAGAVAYGGFRILQDGATPGSLFSFITAFLLAYEPAKRLARFNIDLNNALVGVRVLYEVIDSPPSEAADDDKPALKVTERRIAFENVTFAYKNEQPVLRGMSFTAEPGKLTALVGPSGGGKSTVFNLLLRFYDTGDGRVAIDGQDVRDVSRQSLREQIAYVGQDTFLFRGTVRENIAFGKPGATEEDIIAAAKGAYAHDFIMAFPAGYDTQVGEHGLQLSGGQRQRISIARAFIKDAPIVLLDEATAALDSESELQVREAMDRLCAGRTTLAIAHRLHTISHADRIYVIEGGHASENGRHDELLAKNGRYASFYKLQLSDQEQPAPLAAVAASA